MDAVEAVIVLHCGAQNLTRNTKIERDDIVEGEHRDRVPLSSHGRILAHGVSPATGERDPQHGSWTRG
jgi:hypothetical protein